MAEETTIEGLLSILSSEMLPRYPVLTREDWRDELDRFIRDLLRYIKAQNGKFTARNISNALVTAGVPFVKTWDISYKYHGTDDPTVVIDDSRDWRDYDFFAIGRAGKTISDLRTTTVAPNGDDDKFIGTPQWSTYSLVTLSVDSVSPQLQLDGTTGQLELFFDNSAGTSKTVYTHFWIAAIAKVSSLSGDYVAAGNGL
jgi:hypothetical protein